jgi:hypothetical protein
VTTFTATIPTIASGDTTTVPTNLATYRDALKAATEAWTSYTPTATNFTVGNGTIAGKYAQVGKLIVIRVNFTGGSTSTYTASAFAISLPVAAHGTGGQSLHLRLSSTAGQFAGSADISAGASSFSMAVPTSTANCGLVSMTSATPNPGTAGFVQLSGVYESA